MPVTDTTDGAVSRPFEEMLPAVVDQMTAELFVPLTVALNCTDAPATTVALVGEMVVRRLDGLPILPDFIEENIEQLVAAHRLTMSRKHSQGRTDFWDGTRNWAYSWRSTDWGNIYTPSTWGAVSTARLQIENLSA
jgi:hypothetical protein